MRLQKITIIIVIAAPVDFVLLPESAMQPIPKLNVEPKIHVEILERNVSLKYWRRIFHENTGEEFS